MCIIGEAIWLFRFFSVKYITKSLKGFSECITKNLNLQSKNCKYQSSTIVERT